MSHPVNNSSPFRNIVGLCVGSPRSLVAWQSNYAIFSRLFLRPPAVSRPGMHSLPISSYRILSSRHSLSRLFSSSSLSLVNLSAPRVRSKHFACVRPVRNVFSVRKARVSSTTFERQRQREHMHFVASSSRLFTLFVSHTRD